MTVHRLCLLVALSIASGLGAGPVCGAVVPAMSAPTRFIAVLVHVDDHGKLTRVDSKVKLQPGLRALLQRTLVEMITRPARDAHGKPVGSTLLMKFSVHTTQRTDGTYRATLTYVAAEPLSAARHYYWGRNDPGGPELLQVARGGAGVAAHPLPQHGWWWSIFKRQRHAHDTTRHAAREHAMADQAQGRGSSTH